MIRDRSWTKSTAGVGKSRQAPSWDCGQLGLRKNHKRTSNRNLMRQLSHLGCATCSWLPPGNWLMQTANPCLGPWMPQRAHTHCTQQSRCFLTIQAPRRGIQEGARGKPCPMEKQQDLKPGSSGCCYLLVCVPGHIS